MSEDRRHALLLVLLACLVVVPIGLPGGEGYMDNGPHLVTIQALVDDVLPHDRWFSGWSDLAEAGFAPGQINAPLAWTTVALLATLGLPLTATWLLGVPVANVVFALGAWRLAGRLFAEPRAALLGAALAAVSLPEVYGIAGVAGGMWPFRLAVGVLCWGLGARWGTLARAVWIAAILLLHAYVGVVALAWAGLELLGCVPTRDSRAAVGWSVAITLGMGLAAMWWVPLLDPAIRVAFAEQLRGPLDIALMALLPMDFTSPVTQGFPLRLLADAWSVPGGLLAIVGLVAAWRHLRLRDTALAMRGVVAIGLLTAVLAVVIPLTNWQGLGPNPWRYYVFLRVPLLLVAGAGLARSRWALSLVGFAALATVGAGLTSVPHTLSAAGRTAWQDLEQTWADLRADAPEGRVYVEETYAKSDPGDPFVASHVAALLPLHADRPVLGSWYGTTAIPSHLWTTSEGPNLLGRHAGGPDFNLDHFYTMFRLYQVGAVVTSTADLAGWLTSDPRYRRTSTHGRFAVFRIVEPLQAALGIAPNAGALTEIHVERGRIEATVTLVEEEANVRSRQTWHPWWRATVDGAPMRVKLDERSGMATIHVTQPGHLVLAWVDPDRVGRGLSLASLGLVGAGLLLRRLRPSE